MTLDLTPQDGFVKKLKINKLIKQCERKQTLKISRISDSSIGCRYDMTCLVSSPRNILVANEPHVAFDTIPHVNNYFLYIDNPDDLD